MTTTHQSPPDLAAWLRSTSHSPHSAEDTVSRVMSQVAAQPQATTPRPTTFAPEAIRALPGIRLTGALSALVVLVVVLTGLVLWPGNDEQQLVTAPAASPSSSSIATLPAAPPLEPSPPSSTLAPVVRPGLPVTSGGMNDAGTLVTPRKDHSATLLDDGHVLVLGGQGGGRLRQALVDLWDPETRRFERLPDLVDPRNGHTATRLTDGRVLIVGGYGEKGVDDPIASVEIWDPATASSTMATPLLEPRVHHTATLLPDGRVLIVGGRLATGRVQAAAEIWDPATGSTSPTGTPNLGRFHHTATLLPDGRVLIVGGISRRTPTARLRTNPNHVIEEATASVEIWDPVDGGFTELEDLQTARFGHSTTALADGRVLIVGGSPDDRLPADEQGLRSAEVWDPESRRTGSTGALEFGRIGHSATALDDGRVLVIGGTDVTRAEMWDSATGLFARAGVTDPPREHHSATFLPDGRVLVIGGSHVSGTSRNLGPLPSAQVWVLGAADAAEGPTLDPGTLVAGDVALARRFPAAVEGRTIQVSTRSGEEWHSSFDPDYPSDAAYRDRIRAFADLAGVELTDITLATATHMQDRQAHALAALRIPGVDAGTLVDPIIDLMLGHIGEPETELIQLAGKPVVRVRDASMPGAYPSYVYAEGETIWLVQSEEPILSEIIAALP